MKEFQVPFTVKMKARIRLEDGEDLADAISNIVIPENHQCFYVEGSFEPEEAEDLSVIDVTISKDSGDTVQFLLKTEKARQWVRDNIIVRPGMWIGHLGFYVETAKLADDIIKQMTEAGVNVGPATEPIPL